MGITQSEVSALAARFGNKKVTQQTNMMTVFYAKTIDKRVIRGKTGVVNIKSGGINGGAMKWIADGATLPAKGNNQPVQGTYLPKILFGRCGIPRGAAELVQDVEDGVDLCLEQFDTAGEHLAKMRGRTFIRPDLGKPSASVAAADTTFTTVDPNGFLINEQIEVRDGSGGFIENITITKVAWSLSTPGTATVTFTGGGSGSGAQNAWTTSYKFWKAGSYDQGPVSLADVAADASLYALSQNARDWNGNLDTGTTEVGTETLRNMLTLCMQRRGLNPSCILVSPINRQRISALAVPARRLAAGQVLDPIGGGVKLEFDGVDIVTDPNCPNAEIHFPQLSDMVVHVFRGEHADKDGMGETKISVGAALVDPNEFVWDVQFWTMENLRVTCRAGSGAMTAVAS